MSFLDYLSLPSRPDSALLAKLLKLSPELLKGSCLSPTVAKPLVHPQLLLKGSSANKAILLHSSLSFLSLNFSIYKVGISLNPKAH